MLAVAYARTLAARQASLLQSAGEKARRGERRCGSQAIDPALVIALNCGMRNGEIRHLTWGQIDFEKSLLTVGRAKTQPALAKQSR